MTGGRSHSDGAGLTRRKGGEVALRRSRPNSEAGREGGGERARASELEKGGGGGGRACTATCWFPTAPPLAAPAPPHPPTAASTYRTGARVSSSSGEALGQGRDRRDGDASPGSRALFSLRRAPSHRPSHLIHTHTPPPFSHPSNSPSPLVRNAAPAAAAAQQSRVRVRACVCVGGVPV